VIDSDRVINGAGQVARHEPFAKGNSEGWQGLKQYLAPGSWRLTKGEGQSEEHDLFG